MRSPALVLVPLLSASVVVAGCGSPRGAGRWDLTVGGEAKLRSSDGSDVVLETLVAAPKAKTGRPGRPAAMPTVGTTTVAAGTLVDVLPIDGDDARIRLKDGPHSGLITWVECAKLEPISH